MLDPVASDAAAFDPGAFDPGAFDPGAFDPGAFDPGALWDFDDPVSSQARFGEAAGRADAGPVEAALLMTQVARALGLQERYDEGHLVLDDIASDGREVAEVPAVAARVALERGRLLRSAGEPEQAGPFFARAAATAGDAGLDELVVDALHMTALIAPPADQVGLGEQALLVARASADPRARAWEGSLLNNIAMAHADAGDHHGALPVFEEALACVPDGAAARERVARWMVAWSLRHVGRTDEALAMQLDLRADLTAAGEEDPYVEEEIALLESGPTAR